MKISRLILIIALLVSVFACREGNQYPPLSQVSNVDLNRYLGRWYEIARIDQSFQKDCVASTAADFTAILASLYRKIPRR